MKIQTPKLPPRAALDIIQLQQFMTDTSLEHVLLAHADLRNVQIKSLSLDESLLEKVVLAEARLTKLGVSDSKLQACDLSAARCSDGSFIRTHLVGCRMTGVDLSHCTIKDVVFEDCKLDMANFRSAKLTRVHFVNCTLVETDFLAAELHDVVFQSSHLEKVEFGQCKLRNTDARSSQLFDIRGWQSLRGLHIDSLQLASIAPQLALALGLVVKD
jgi:uncharacterized protein YjbI with pentapeptide repeats